MTRTVLVTGASGFMGRALVPRLAAAGWQVRAAARDVTAINPGQNISVVAMPELSGPHDWSPLVEGMSHVLHLAGIAHATSAISDSTYFAVNATATRALAQAARAARLQRVVFMSSVRAQCGPSSAMALSESDPAAPQDAYGRAKLEGERELATQLAPPDTGLASDWCALRPVLVYGPGVKGNMAALRKLATLSLPLPLGSLTARRSLLGISNLFSAVEHALTSPAASRATFLVADPGPLTVPEIIAAMRAGLGRGPGTFSVPLAPAHVAARLAGKEALWQRIAGDLVVSTKALEDSGWRPVETAAEGLARWMRE